MLNEFRQDPISGEWVLFATNRAGGHLGQKEEFYQPVEECPFEELEKASGEPPVLVFNHGREIPWHSDVEWTTAVIKNKFPALTYGLCGEVIGDGFWQKAEALGFHELVITRDHEKHFAQFTDVETAEVLTAYQKRFKAIQKDSCGKYVLILHNHGRTAGASIFHNHSQILSLPFVPPGVATSLANTERYHIQHGVSPFQVMLDWENKEGKRIVFKNDSFMVFCPYASRTPYELRIYPLAQDSRFENLPPEKINRLAEALKTILAKISLALNNPDYNFYIHTSPADSSGKSLSDAYRWHIEIVPRLSVIASVELGTNVFVNVIDPDDAAAELRNK